MTQMLIQKLEEIFRQIQDKSIARTEAADLLSTTLKLLGNHPLPTDPIGQAELGSLCFLIGNEYSSREYDPEFKTRVFFKDGHYYPQWWTDVSGWQYCTDRLSHEPLYGLDLPTVRQYLIDKYCMQYYIEFERNTE